MKTINQNHIKLNKTTNFIIIQIRVCKRGNVVEENKQRMKKNS